MKWSKKAINQQAGYQISDRRTHEPKCKKPGRTTKSCDCPNAIYYTEEEAKQLKKDRKIDIVKNLVLIPNEMGAWVLDMKELAALRNKRNYDNE